MTVAAPAVPKMAVSYGAFDLDEATGCLVTTPYDTLDQPTDGSVYLEFHCRLTEANRTGVEATDDALFYGYVAALETALRIPRQRFLAQTNGITVKDLNFGSGMTAFLITPELRLLEEKQHDYKYSLRIRCGYVGNVVGNAYRITSSTTIGDSLSERRMCSIMATWTASNGETAYANFLAGAADFYAAYLPANLVDQHSTTGLWTQQSEDPRFNDEQVASSVGGSLLTVTRVYWEIFAGRRASETKTVTTIGDQRVCTIAALYAASPDGPYNALQNFADNGGAFFAAQLPTPLTNGAWVLVSSDPVYVDTIGTLQVTNTYQECIHGLARYTSVVTADRAGIRTLVVDGVYYATGATAARTNYTNNVQTLVTALLAAESITHFEALSVPLVTRTDQNGLRFFFTWTIHELAIAQGTGGFDNTNVTMEWINLEVTKPFDGQSVTAGNPVTRLQTVEATFIATISLASSGGTDPVTLWNDGLRAYVVTLCGTKLGADVSTVEVVGERVGAGFHINQLVGRLTLVVEGGGVLWCRIIQCLVQVPGRDFAPRADGTAFSYYPYRCPPEMLLHREATCEYVVGTTPPVLFAESDNTVSGFGLMDMGTDAQSSIDAQNSSSTMDVGENWFIDRRAAEPFSVLSAPTTRGDMGGFETVVVKQVENWRYVAALEPGTTL